ncbi:ubiquitin-like domain-containing protein, partial [Nocardiopsis sp. NPDC006832]|uniref:ubiquitin-like domain-containing protein n=1 Tax=Nocardiopsis sp. NPDC006832 TaxID=3157188 RepID=UPI00340B370E
MPGGRSAKGRRRAPLPVVPRLVVAAVVTGALTLALAGGGTALATDRGVTIDVDGTETIVHTFGGTVADALAEAGVEL